MGTIYFLQVTSDTLCRPGEGPAVETKRYREGKKSDALQRCTFCLVSQYLSTSLSPCDHTSDQVLSGLHTHNQDTTNTDNYAQTRALLLTAHVNIYKAMGGGWVNQAEMLTEVQAP